MAGGDPALTEAACQALVDQWTAHENDPNRPADCRCWDCRLPQAIDAWELRKREELSRLARMTRPLRDRVVPMNRQFPK